LYWLIGDPACIIAAQHFHAVPKPAKRKLAKYISCVVEIETGHLYKGTDYEKAFVFHPEHLNCGMITLRLIFAGSLVLATQWELNWQHE